MTNAELYYSDAARPTSEVSRERYESCSTGLLSEWLQQRLIRCLAIDDWQYEDLCGLLQRLRAND